MIAPLTITEQLMYSTVRLTMEYNSGQRGHATSFVYTWQQEQRTYAALITCAHAIKNAQNIKITLHKGHLASSNNPEPIEEDYHDTVQLKPGINFIEHHNIDIDLCAIDFIAIWTKAYEAGINLYQVSLDDSAIADNPVLSEYLSAVEDVLMIGYPNGLIDEVNNFPIFRKGITATHPGLDFNMRPLVAVDIACFPGSSGSPILIVHEGGAVKTKEGGIIYGSQQVLLLGILTEGITISSSGLLEINRLPILDQTISQKKLAVMNLGYYTKAEQIISMLTQQSTNFSFIDTGNTDVPLIPKLKRC